MDQYDIEFFKIKITSGEEKEGQRARINKIKNEFVDFIKNKTEPE